MEHPFPEPHQPPHMSQELHGPPGYHSSASIGHFHHHRKFSGTALVGFLCPHLIRLTAHHSPGFSDAQISLLSREHLEPIPAPGPLHLWFPLAWSAFPQDICIAPPFTSFQALFNCPIPREGFPDHPIKNVPLPSHPHFFKRWRIVTCHTNWFPDAPLTVFVRGCSRGDR